MEGDWLNLHHRDILLGKMWISISAPVLMLIVWIILFLYVFCIIILLIQKSIFVFLEGAECGINAEVEKQLEMGKKLLAAGQLADALSHFHAAIGMYLKKVMFMLKQLWFINFQVSLMVHILELKYKHTDSTNKKQCLLTLYFLGHILWALNCWTLLEYMHLQAHCFFFEVNKIVVLHRKVSVAQLITINVLVKKWNVNEISADSELLVFCPSSVRSAPLKYGEWRESLFLCYGSASCYGNGLLLPLPLCGCQSHMFTLKLNCNLRWGKQGTSLVCSLDAFYCL